MIQQKHKGYQVVFMFIIATLLHAIHCNASDKFTYVALTTKEAKIIATRYFRGSHGRGYQLQGRVLAHHA